MLNILSASFLHGPRGEGKLKTGLEVADRFPKQGRDERRVPQLLLEAHVGWLEQLAAGPVDV